MSTIFELVKISTVYQAPSGKDNRRPTFRKILLGYLFNTIVIGGAYGFLSFVIFSSGQYQLWDMYLGFLLVMSMFQSFSLMFNTLYLSRDLNQYLPLPISHSTIYISKLLTVTLGNSIFIVPIGILTSMLFYSAGYSLSVVLAIGVLVLITFGLTLMVFNVGIIELMARSGLLHKLGEKVITILNLVIQVLSIVFIFSTTTQLTIDSDLPVTHGIGSTILLGHTRGFILVSILFTVISGGIIYVLGRSFVPHYQKLQEIRIKKAPTKKRSKSLAMSIYRYKMEQVLDATVLSASVFTPTLMTFAMSISILSSRGEYIDIGAGSTLMLFVEGLLLIMILTGIGTLPKIIISLDGENFEYLKSLPISKEEYIAYNTRLSTGIMGILGIITIIALSIILEVSALWTGAIMVHFLVVLYLINSYMVRKDYNNPNLTWTSATELITSKGSKLLYFGALMLSVIINSLFLFTVLEMDLFTINFVNIVLMSGYLILGAVLYVLE